MGEKSRLSLLTTSTQWIVIDLKKDFRSKMSLTPGQNINWKLQKCNLKMFPTISRKKVIGQSDQRWLLTGYQKQKQKPIQSSHQLKFQQTHFGILYRHYLFQPTNLDWLQACSKICQRLPIMTGENQLVLLLNLAQKSYFPTHQYLPIEKI